jgi:hypothetical protein
MVGKDFRSTLFGLKSLFWGCPKRQKPQRKRDLPQRIAEKCIDFQLSQCKFETGTAVKKSLFGQLKTVTAQLKNEDGFFPLFASLFSYLCRPDCEIISGNLCI